MKKKSNNTETLELYRSLLPPGGQSEVARRLGINRVAIAQFLSGKYHSDKIENAILDYIADYKQEKEARLRKAGLL